MVCPSIATPPIREAGLEPSVWPPLFSDHHFTSAQIALLEQVRWSNAYVRRALLQLSANPERGNHSCLYTKNLRSLAKGLLCAQGQIPETNVLLSDRSNVVQSSG